MRIIHLFSYNGLPEISLSITSVPAPKLSP